ncbi:zinc finger protein 585A [Anabrus simplex]|uniref:zinc finger protein 585A n=1 Tax=Anabrus simplex TaxID=316456 RepID=UPI0035A2B7FD
METNPEVNVWNGLVSTNLCRLCGEENEELVPIFGEQGAEMDLQEKIHSYLPILVAEEDLLPLSVCTLCISNLMNFHQFVNTCYEANTKLISLLQSAGFTYEDEQNQNNEIQKEIPVTGYSKTVPEGEGSFYVDTEIKDEPMDYEEVTLPPAGNVVIGDLSQDSHPSDISVLNQELADGRSKEEGRNETSNTGPDGDNNIDGGFHNDENQTQINEEDRTLNEKKKQIRSLERKLKSNTKFKVIVVKLKNSQNLPRDEQVARALQLLEQKKGPSNKNLGEEIPAVVEERKDVSASDSQPLSEVSVTAEYADLSQEKEKKNYICMYCKKETDGRESLILHHIAEHPTKVFYCSECDVVCQSKETFNRHLTRHKIIGSQLILSPKSESETKSTEESVEISNVVNVNIDKSKPSICMKVSDDFKDMDTFLKSKIVKTIKQIVSIGGNTGTRMCQKKQKRKIRWQCKQCSHVSTNREDFLIHKSTHPPPIFRCRICDKNCRTKMRLMVHERSHTQEKPFICEYCGKCFRYQNTLRVHLFTHGKIGKVFNCTECDKTFSNRNSLTIHMKSHSSEIPYLCDVCGKTVKHISNFRSHRKLHLDPDFRRRYMCDECGKQLLTRARLVEHKRLHSNELPLACPTCDKRFRTQGQLSQHLQIHVNARRHCCNVCGKRFNRRGNMVSHMKRHNAHKCRVCSEAFLSFSDLQSHLNTHTVEELNAAKQLDSMKTEGDENSSGYQCEICHKILSSKPSLNHHMRIHSGEKPYCCEFCGKKFSVKGSLTFHLMVHSGHKPYVCRFCQKGCLTKQSLIVHERYHTGEKPFSCETCGMAFRSKVNLNQHLVVHSDERPFLCPHCDKRFRRRDALDTHLRIHTGERPYPCKVCGRRFRQKGDCNKHERSHFKPAKLRSDIFQCFACELTFNTKQECHYHMAEAHDTGFFGESQAIVIATNPETSDAEKLKDGEDSEAVDAITDTQALAASNSDTILQSEILDNEAIVNECVVTSSEFFTV